MLAQPDQAVIQLETRILQLRNMWLDKTISWEAFKHMRRAAYAACIYEWNQHG